MTTAKSSHLIQWNCGDCGVYPVVALPRPFPDKPQLLLDLLPGK